MSPGPLPGETSGDAARVADDHADPTRVRGPVDGLAVPRFAGISTFARLPLIDEVQRAHIAVVGVPFDTGTTYRPGARLGPSAIRQASRLLRPFNPHSGTFPFADHQVVDAGDIACTPFSSDQAVGEIEAGMRGLLERAPIPIVLGGDHTVALPVLRCMRAHAGEPIAVVHFDAHLDTWDSYFGASYTHGTPFRRAAEEGLLWRQRCVHVGVRGPLYGIEDVADDSDLGFRILSTPFVARTGAQETAESIKAMVGDAPVYVSVDIDVLDPAFAPGTGTPEPGGLLSRELLAVLRHLRGIRLVGADVVEVSPPFDSSEVTALVAANVAYDLISLLAEPRGPAYGQ
jgi:agmatinase